jgi:hypothetical protein
MSIEPINPTTEQRQKMEKLVDRIDRVTQSDRLFFERRPDRQHRIRLASQAEIKEAEILEMTAPAGVRLYIAVRNVKPGFRLRVYLTAREGMDTDVDEATARMVFENVSPKQVHA